MIATILYVAASDSAAADGANALERVGSDLAVEPAVEVEKVRAYAPSVDCVVFAETPTTPAGSHLLEVIDACGPTPVVLYTDATFGPAIARSTDGVAGYVRREGDASMAHLADEVAWVCHEPADQESTSGPNTNYLHELASRIGVHRDEAALLEVAIDAAEGALDVDACAIFLHESNADGDRLVPTAVSSETPGDGFEPVRPDEGVVGAAFRNGRAYRIDDTDEESAGPTLEAWRSAIAVPVGEAGVLLAAAERANAFDDDELAFAELLVGHVDAALSRIRLEEKLRERREHVAGLRADVARLAAERDRLETLFDAVPHPIVRYEVVNGTAVVRDGNERFEAVFNDGRDLAVGATIGDVLAPPADEEGGADVNERLLAGETQRAVARRGSATDDREFVVDAVPLESGSRGVAICTDVTDRAKLEKELTDRDERLEALADLVDEQFRPPLNVAMAYLEIVTETDDPEHYAEIEEAHERLSERIDDVRALATGDQADDDGEERAAEFTFGV